jgi:hypothetical protein
MWPRSLCRAEPPGSFETEANLVAGPDLAQKESDDHLADRKEK